MDHWPETIDVLPPPFDEERAARLAEKLSGIGLGARFARLAAFVAGSSPYLTQSMTRETALMPTLEQDGALAVAEAEIAAAHEARHLSATDLSIALRRAKRRAALAIALGDVAGALDLDQVTGLLTRFADAALRSAIHAALTAETASGRFKPADPSDPARGSGLIVLAMGKYGAFELNYSSDIDFTVFFDGDVLPVAPGIEPVPFLVRVVKSVVKALQERTGEGYVFRTDLRLRPDAGATQVAISTAAAAIYYEGMGQNWERAAMIKARAAAGDIPAGEAFIAELRPFVWRKYLDYAAIEDIQSIKRQINAHKGGAQVAIAGHDVKLGRGGIREVEFFAQTQQLILGGRYPGLRQRRTLDALWALTQENVVDIEAEADLRDAYRWLRTLEHRIQMVADEQTHRIPENDTERANIARFMGYDDIWHFEVAALGTFRTVERHYAALFESSAPLSAESGSLVFTGVDDDPETVKTLASLGFKRPDSVSAAVRGWHHGRMASTRSARARELLTALMPAILAALGRTAEPDVALARFDSLLRGLPAGVQLFSLLKANTWLLDVLAEVCGGAPRLARHLARNPAVLDALLDPAYLSERPTREEADAAFVRALDENPEYEPMLDAMRRTARELRFRVGFQFLRGVMGPEEMGSAYAMIAESALLAVASRVRATFEAQHGRVEGGAFAIIALGRLGAAKMTASSDLDLVFLYDHADDTAASDGRTPLVPTVYFNRLSQRLIAAINAPTAEGKLYEVDMRLRPSGSKGPLAVRLATFQAYQRDEAWTWERMALTRARVVVADSDFGVKVRSSIRELLVHAGDRGVINADAAAMRGRLLRDKPAKGPFNLKTVRGGMVDIEFIAQTGLLIAGPSHPDIFTGSTQSALANLSDVGALSADDYHALADAYLLYSRVNHMLRLTSEEDETTLHEIGLQRLVVRAAGATDFADLTAKIIATEADVADRFERLVGNPV